VACDLEAALVACAAGEEAGLKEIYQREAPRLLAVAYRIVGRRDLAEDVVQDAFLQIWKHARSFDPNRGAARGWIYSLVRNRARKLRRAQARHEAIDDQVLLAIFDGVGSTEDSTPHLSEKYALRRHLAKLDPKKCAILTLAYVEGCTHREIAAQLGVPIGTAKAWIRRSLMALRSDFGERVRPACGGTLVPRRPKPPNTERLVQGPMPKGRREGARDGIKTDRRREIF
jgi:RNA polymerase sigma-70 factor (ECF subfamily)